MDPSRSSWDDERLDKLERRVEDGLQARPTHGTVDRKIKAAAAGAGSQVTKGTFITAVVIGLFQTICAVIAAWATIKTSAPIPVPPVK